MRLFTDRSLIGNIKSKELEDYLKCLAGKYSREILEESNEAITAIHHTLRKKHALSTMSPIVLGRSVQATTQSEDSILIAFTDGSQLKLQIGYEDIGVLSVVVYVPTEDTHILIKGTVSL